MSGDKIALGAAALLALASLSRRGSRSGELGQLVANAEEISAMEFALRRDHLFQSENEARIKICQVINSSRTTWGYHRLLNESKTRTRGGTDVDVNDDICHAFPLYRVSGGLKVGKKPAWLKLMTGKERPKDILEQIEWLQERLQRLGYSPRDRDPSDEEDEDWHDDDGEDDEDERPAEDVRPISGFQFAIDINHDIPEWVYDYLHEEKSRWWNRRYNPSIMEVVADHSEDQVNDTLGRYWSTSSFEALFDSRANFPSSGMHRLTFHVQISEFSFAKLEPLKQAIKEASKVTISGPRVDINSTSAHEIELGLSRAHALLNAREEILGLIPEIEEKIERTLSSSRWWRDALDAMGVEVEEEDLGDEEEEAEDE
jgi:hypothetical protein